jgi:hypothetical protein
VSETNVIEMHWISKMNSASVKQMIGTIPKELMKDDVEEVYRKIRRYRQLQIQPSIPVIHLEF